MTDFDTLIDNVVESAKECENEHEHRGFYTESIKKNHDAARSALRAAIDEVVRERDNLLTVLHGNQDADYDKQLQIETLKEANATLEAALKEANEDAKRLAHLSARGATQCMTTIHDVCTRCTWYKDCPILLHRARVAKGEG